MTFQESPHHLTRLLAALSLFGATACSLPDLDEDDDAADSSGAATDTDDTATDTDGTDADTGSSGSGGADESTTGTGETATTGADNVLNCGDGRLVMGAPFGDPAARPADGDPAIDMADGAASLSARHLEPDPSDDSRLLIGAGSEIWMLDLASSTVHKILGDREAGELNAGSCDTATIGNVSDLAFRSDGTAYLADHSGNAILKLVDPFGPDCELQFYAGTQERVFTGALPEDPGNVDGPVADSRFAGPDYITVDDDDNLWVLDIGNRGIRRIGTDDVVETLAVTPGEYLSASGGTAANEIVALGGKIYLPARGSIASTQNATILEIDVSVEGGEFREVATGRDDPWLVGSSGPDMASLTIAGEGLVATWVNGRIFTIDVNDGTVTHVAGDGDKEWQSADFSDDFDPGAETPALEFELDNLSAATSGASAYLTATGTKLYFSGQAQGFVNYELDCD